MLELRSIRERCKVGSIRSSKTHPLQILQKYGLVRDDQITFGAYLLFVKDFCLISGIQAGRFKTPTDIIDSISLNTDILTEIDELMKFYHLILLQKFKKLL